MENHKLNENYTDAAFKWKQAAKECKKERKEKQDFENKVKTLTAEKYDAVNEKNVAYNAVQALKREIEWLQKQTINELQSIDGLVRDRDKMLKDIDKVDQENQERRNEIKMLENAKKQIMEQLAANKEHLK